MTRPELLELWQREEQAARIHGWDFSHIEGRYREYPLSWDYGSIIRKYLKPTDILLDIDTGGGEFLDSLGHGQEFTYATEVYAPNVQLCRKKYADTDVHFFELNDYSHMPFGDESFDVVINRHGTYDASEIYRVLKKGGFFITQQVGENNDRELVERLLPECKKQFVGHNLEKQASVFEKCGFEILEKGEEFVPIEFYDTGALVWFAKIIEWEFVGFSVEQCFDALLSVEKKIEKDGKAVCSAHRFYLVAKKCEIKDTLKEIKLKG